MMQKLKEVANKQEMINKIKSYKKNKKNNICPICGSTLILFISEDGTCSDKKVCNKQSCKYEEELNG